MEENKVIMMEPANDELTQHITARLAERQRKLQLMQEWERPARKIPLFGSAMALLAAACIAALLIFSPWKNVSPLDELSIHPDMTEFRSASPDIAEIQQLLEKPDYTTALARTEKALHHSDMELKEMQEVDASWGTEEIDEELEYEEKLERSMNSELRWTYIYLLVKEGKNKEAVRELKKYIRNKEFCEHETEAKLLLKALK